MKKLICFFALLILSLVSCTATSQPMPTAMPVLSSTPTNTLVPINTPTTTLQPMATSCIVEPDSISILQSVQDRIATLIPDARVTWYDDFNCDALSNGWGLSHENSTTKMIVANSAVTISAQKVENVWEGFSRTSDTLEDSKGMLVLFQYKAGTSVLLFVHTGDWQTSNYRRWGLNINSDPGNIWQGWDGTKWVGSDFPSNVLRPNTPFYLMIRLNDNGMLTTKVWEKDNPNNFVAFQKSMRSTWVGHRWVSLFQLIEGTLEIDEYLEFSFKKP